MKKNKKSIKRKYIRKTYKKKGRKIKKRSYKKKGGRRKKRTYKKKGGSGSSSSSSNSVTIVVSTNPAKAAEVAKHLQTKEQSTVSTGSSAGRNLLPSTSANKEVSKQVVDLVKGLSGEIGEETKLPENFGTNLDNIITSLDTDQNNNCEVMKPFFDKFKSITTKSGGIFGFIKDRIKNGAIKLGRTLADQANPGWEDKLMIHPKCFPIEYRSDEVLTKTVNSIYNRLFTEFENAGESYYYYNKPPHSDTEVEYIKSEIINIINSDKQIVTATIDANKKKLKGLIENETGKTRDDYDEIVNGITEFESIFLPNEKGILEKFQSALKLAATAVTSVISGDGGGDGGGGTGGGGGGSGGTGGGEEVSGGGGGAGNVNAGNPNNVDNANAEKAGGGGDANNNGGAGGGNTDEGGGTGEANNNGGAGGGGNNNGGGDAGGGDGGGGGANNNGGGDAGGGAGDGGDGTNNVENAEDTVGNNPGNAETVVAPNAEKGSGGD